jgi:hypothetical protein
VQIVQICRATITGPSRFPKKQIGFFNEAIDVDRKYGAKLPAGHSTMRMYPIDGAASRVPPRAEDATAFGYRNGGWAGVIVGVDPDPPNAALISQWGTGLLAGAAPDLSWGPPTSTS